VAIVQVQAVGGAGAGPHAHRDHARQVAGQRQRGQDQGRCAVADRRTVVEVDRGRDHRRLTVGLCRDRAAEHGVGVVDRVLVGVEAEDGEVVVCHPVLVQVALHDQRVEGDEGHAVGDLVVGVGGGRQAGGDLAAGGFGHLLHAAHGHHVGQAAGDGPHAGHHGYAAGGAGRLDGGGFDPAPAGIVGDQGAQLGLVVQAGGQHVAHVQGLRLQVGDAGVGDRRLEGLDGHLAQAQLPLLADGRLADSDDAYLTHRLLLATGSDHCRFTGQHSSTGGLSETTRLIRVGLRAANRQPAPACSSSRTISAAVQWRVPSSTITSGRPSSQSSWRWPSSCR